mmetsp:Transcript_5283/g.11787  ORF Transcript_5283/g.11787 Transcript_5283/m.11787 type:complete len:850 (-) Transcript_5283:642-3191(-)
METVNRRATTEVRRAVTAIGLVAFFAFFLAGPRLFGADHSFSLTAKRMQLQQQQQDIANARRSLLSDSEGEGEGNSTGGEDCPIPLNASQAEKCAFINATAGCQPEGLFNYLHLYYCQVSAQADPAILTLFIFWLIVLFITLGSSAEDFFCPSLTYISRKLKLKPRFAGVTLLAFGNGAPDVFSVLAAVQQGQPGLAMGELTGAGVFVTTVVVGAVALASGKSGIKARGMFLRDVASYLIAAAIVFVIFIGGKMTLWYALMFILLYVLYVVFVVVGVRIPPLLSGDRALWHVKRIKDKEAKRAEKQKKQREKEEKKEQARAASVQLAEGSINAVGEEKVVTPGSGSDNKRKGKKVQILVEPSPLPSPSTSLLGGGESNEEGERGAGGSSEGAPLYDSADTTKPTGRLSRSYSRDTVARRNSMLFFSKIGALSRRFSIHRLGSLSKMRDLPGASSSSSCINLCFPLTNVKDSHKHVHKGFFGHLAHAIGWDEKGVMGKIIYVIESPIMLLRVLSIPILFDADCSDEEGGEGKKDDKEGGKDDGKDKKGGEGKKEEKEEKGEEQEEGQGGEAKSDKSKSEGVTEGKGEGESEGEAKAEDVDVSDENEDEVWEHVFQRIISVLNPACFFAFFSFYILQLVSDPSITVGSSPLPVWFLIFLPGVPLSVITFFATAGNRRPPKWIRGTFVVMSFLNSIAWIDLLASELVALLEALGYILDIDHVILGLTVLAWGNSLGDLLADVAVAKQGYPSMAITACYGCPLFNMMLGLGISFTAVCASSFPTSVPVSLDIHLFISFLCLGGILAITMLSTLVLKFRLPRPFGAVLLCMYAVFTIMGILAYTQQWVLPPSWT